MYLQRKIKKSTLVKINRLFDFEIITFRRLNSSFSYILTSAAYFEPC